MICVIALIISGISGVLAQTNIGTISKNYVAKIRPQTAISNSSSISQANSQIDIIYYDGFGRPVQNIAVGNGETICDIVDYIEYDSKGQISRHYMPTTGIGQGAYTCVETIQNNSQITYPGEIYTYSSILYESEPQSPMSVQYAPGDAWHNSNGVRYIYTMNQIYGIYQCNNYRILPNDDMLKKEGYYAQGELHVTLVIDEDDCRILIFTDVQGRTILERRLDLSNKKYDTYYVYDIYGNLRYILPPKASVEMVSDGEYSDDEQVISELCYTYRYNNKRQCTAKRIPGGEWIYYGYDCTGTLIYTQTGNQRATPMVNITYTLYDKCGRLATIGTMNYSDSISIEDYMNSDKSRYIYTEYNQNQWNAYFGYKPIKDHINPIDIQQVNYYDDYSFLSLFPQHTDSLNYCHINSFDSRQTTPYQSGVSPTKGLQTGIIKRIGNTGEIIVEVYYYDRYGRIIQTRRNNTIGGYDTESYCLRFDGKVIQTLKTHSTTTDTIQTCHMIKQNYTYDHRGNLLTETIQIDGGTPTTIISNHYDEIGRLESLTYPLNVGSTDYSYNIRGWITEIDNPYFSQTLYYNTTSDGSDGSLNGNIVEQRFTQIEGNGTISNLIEGGFRYHYDELNRLTMSVYSQTTRDILDIQTRVHDFNGTTYTSSYSYDPNSNLTGITRTGFRRSIIDETTVPNIVQHNYGIIDNLTLSYNGNKLIKTSDSASEVIMVGATDFVDNADADEEYSYDANGNMTSDLNKGIETITYNLNNLPTQICFEDGHRINNYYDSFGNRCRTEYILVSEEVFTPGAGEIIPDEDESGQEQERVIVECRRDYCAEFIYEDGELERILTSNGYYKGGRYYFYVKDYQGNNRVTVNSTRRVDSGAGGVQLNRINAVDVQVYYPYGMKITDLFRTDTDMYRYGGKEFMSMHDLQHYDYSARWYDSQLGRFTTPDPLQEKYPHLSPYCYGLCNPILYVDPDGRDGIRIVNHKNRTITIMANYYVLIGKKHYSQNGKIQYLDGYSSQDVVNMNKDINQYLNKTGYNISSGEYKGYSVSFNLDFKESPTLVDARVSVLNDEIGNSIEKGTVKTDQNIGFELRVDEEGIVKVSGGKTQEKSVIIMNSEVQDNTFMNLLHEIFHTLGLNHPKGQGADSGIMAYPPKKPTEEDILRLLENDFLKLRYE